MRAGKALLQTNMNSSNASGTSIYDFLKVFSDHFVKCEQSLVLAEL